MAAKKDYYAALGVAKDAAAEEIKRAYRKLARRHHPDVNPGDPAAEERFKEVAEAYHVLGDKERRAAYDRGPERFAQEFDLSDFMREFSHGSGRGGGGGISFGLGGISFGGGIGDLSDLFGGGAAAGGRGRAYTAVRPGRDVEVELPLSFAEAIEGTEKSVRYQLPGAGGVVETVSTKVRIPAGVEDGKRIRVSGRGEPGQGGAPAGNLYLRLQVAPHRLYKRRGRDLYLDLPVTVYEAGLGATIRVPTLNGKATIKLPEGTRNGQVIRLAGRGVGGKKKEGGEKPGDLFVTVRIELPNELDPKTKELLRRFARERPYDPRQRLD